MHANKLTEIVAATAADDNYVVPLAVTVKSAIETLAPGKLLRLFILDGGISASNRKALMESWVDRRVRIEWVTPDIQEVSHLPVSDHVSISCYLRLLLPELLPHDIEKLIYFDSDMLIKRDLSELYAEPLGDHLALAVQEMAAPWMDAELAKEGYQRRQKFLAAARPVPNYQELGIPPEAPYFNSGLLVFDAKRWREEEFPRKVFACLQDNEPHVLWWDQYALNVELVGKWRQLDVRWNQTAATFQYPSWQESPLEKEEFRLLRDEPWVVHYCSPTKPWHYYCDHPYRQDFYKVLSRTEWRNWQPEKPDDMTYATWRQLRLKFKRAIRNISAKVRRKAA